jgi:hypothetical protein
MVVEKFILLHVRFFHADVGGLRTESFSVIHAAIENELKVC